jgi:phosphoribosylglycinamide formyltransferase-1
MSAKKIAVFASGAGSTLQFILDQIHINKFNFQVALVVLDRENVGAEKIAVKNKIPVLVSKDETKILTALNACAIEFIILAGFLRKIDSSILNQFNNRIVNTHPSLLPKYGGKGMFGMKVHAAVFAAKENVSGVTIHHVNEHYDEGKIILQKSVSIKHCKSAADVEALVKDLEKQTLLEFLKTL